MQPLKELLRLVFTTTLSNREIGRAVSLSHNTIDRYRRLARSQSLTWETLATRSPEELDHLFNTATGRLTQKQPPDWTWVHEQMQHRGMTRTVLWEEYRRGCPDHALAYSQFSHYYRKYLRTLHPSMRQNHPPGERAFVDFSGRRPAYVDQATGQRVDVELFVAVLGYSNYVFALACPSQQLPHWIHANVCMFEAFDGVPRIVVPDNLRSAVTRAGRDPVVNRSYQEMATHYGTVILPTRSRRPKDKAKVEGSVLIVQRWVLLCLRHRTFFSLAELNRAIAEQIDVLNRRPFKKMEGCRRDRYETTEKAAMLPLPTMPYEFGEWTAAQTVPTDYHVSLARHWYSVPFTYIGRAIEGRISPHHVEIFCAGVRIATHRRGAPGGTTTDLAHLPEAHKAYAARSPEHFQQWAEQIGPAMAAFVRQQFDRIHPSLGLPCCDRLQGLERKYGAADLEAAAERALEIHALSEKTLRTLLASGRHRHPRQDQGESAITPPTHSNIRGGDYYASAKEA